MLPEQRESGCVMEETGGGLDWDEVGEKRRGEGVLTLDEGVAVRALREALFEIVGCALALEFLGFCLEGPTCIHAFVSYVSST
jgi:hypothetical protein